MNQMVPIHPQEPVSIHDQLVAAHKARQARYATAALIVPRPINVGKIRFEDVRRTEREERRKREEDLSRYRQVEEDRKFIMLSRLRNVHAAVRSLLIGFAIAVHSDKRLPKTWMSVRDIQKIVSRELRVSKTDLLSSRRTADVVGPRQIAMYLSRTLTLQSLPEIGRLFGGRDHTTVLHAVRKTTAMMEADPEFRAKVEELRAAVTGQVGG